jgi:hypothetical protein
MLTTSQAAETFCSGQPVKIISGGTGQSNVSLLGSPTKAIPLAQAQQMGLLSPTKLQQIFPTSPTKQVSTFFISSFIYSLKYNILNKSFVCVLAEYYCKQTRVISCKVTSKNNDASLICCKISCKNTPSSGDATEVSSISYRRNWWGC